MKKLILAVLLPSLLATKQVLANDDSIRLLCIDTKGVMEPTYITLNLQRGSYMEEDDVLGDDCAVMSEVTPEEVIKMLKQQNYEANKNSMDVDILNTSGLIYNPVNNRWTLHPKDLDVNYFIHARSKPRSQT